MDTDEIDTAPVPLKNTVQLLCLPEAEIVALRSEIERLRAALQQIVDEADSDYGMTGGDAADVARMALAEAPPL